MTSIDLTLGLDGPTPRTARAAVGGVVYHVLNRGNGRMGVFRKPGDYRAFLHLLLEGKEKAKVDLLGFCLMPNHWHLVVRPKGDGDLAGYLSWGTDTQLGSHVGVPSANRIFNPLGMVVTMPA